MVSSESRCYKTHDLHSIALQHLQKGHPWGECPSLPEASWGQATCACQRVLSNRSFQVWAYQWAPYSAKSGSTHHRNGWSAPTSSHCGSPHHDAPFGSGPHCLKFLMRTSMMRRRRWSSSMTMWSRGMFTRGGSTHPRWWAQVEYERADNSFICCSVRAFIDVSVYTFSSTDISHLQRNRYCKWHYNECS